MKTLQTLFLLFVLFNICGCSQNKAKKPAQIRWGQFLISDSAAHISLSRKGTEIYAADLDYATLTEYQKYPPGKYTVSVKTDGQEILNKKIGLGTDGIYTLSLYGMPLKDQKTNQSSTSEHLHRITEGAAAETANAYLPQLDIMDDYFASAQNESKIRIVHLAPGVEPINASISKSGNKKVSFSGIPYPKSGKNKSLNNGRNTISLSLNGSSQEISKNEFDVEKEKLYTFFVIPYKNKYLDHLRLVKGITPKMH